MQATVALLQTAARDGTGARKRTQCREHRKAERAIRVRCIALHFDFGGGLGGDGTLSKPTRAKIARRYLTCARTRTRCTAQHSTSLPSLLALP